MKDFSVSIYKKLLKSLISNEYQFQTFNDFLQSPKERAIMLRHDVDLLPKNSLLFARIQNNLGIKGTYYFRAVPESWDTEIIVEIASLGHEIGYHYENLTTCKGNLVEGIKDFENNLRELRKLVPVTTICMHGSPASKYDSKDLWKKYNYSDFGIKGEPYFNLNFNKVFYLTDTGRRWDGSRVSVRDKVKTDYKLTFHSTDEIIGATIQGKLPNQVMMTFHPQRWHDDKFNWLTEYMYQNIKNLIKKYFFVK